MVVPVLHLRASHDAVVITGDAPDDAPPAGDGSPLVSAVPG